MPVECAYVVRRAQWWLILWALVLLHGYHNEEMVESRAWMVNLGDHPAEYWPSYITCVHITVHLYGNYIGKYFIFHQKSSLQITVIRCNTTHRPYDVTRSVLSLFNTACCSYLYWPRKAASLSQAVWVEPRISIIIIIIIIICRLSWLFNAAMPPALLGHWRSVITWSDIM